MSVCPIQHTHCVCVCVCYTLSLFLRAFSLTLFLLRSSHASRIFPLVSHNSCCFCFYSFLRWWVRWRRRRQSSSSSGSASANNNIDDDRFSAYAKINQTVAISRIREYELDSRTVRFLPKKKKKNHNFVETLRFFKLFSFIVYRFCYLRTFYRWCELKIVACFGFFFPPDFSRKSQNHDDNDVRGSFF